MQPVGVRVARQGLPVSVAGLGWWDAERRRSWCSTAAREWGTAGWISMREASPHDTVVAPTQCVGNTDYSAVVTMTSQNFAIRSIQ